MIVPLVITTFLLQVSFLASHKREMKSVLFREMKQDLRVSKKKFHETFEVKSFAKRKDRTRTGLDLGQEKVLPEKDEESQEISVSLSSQKEKAEASDPLGEEKRPSPDQEASMEMVMYDYREPKKGKAEKKGPSLQKKDKVDKGDKVDKEGPPSQKKDKGILQKFVEQGGFLPEKGLVQALLEKKKSFNSLTEVLLLGASFSKGLERTNAIVDFHGDAERSDLFYSTNGKMVVQKFLNGKNTVLSGTLISRNTIPTRIDLLMEKDDNLLLEVPLFDRESFYAFLEKKKLTDRRAFLLVDMIEESAMDVDVDVDYREKVYLNEELKEVTPEESFHFVLFLSLQPGNAMISYKTSSGVVDKIIHTRPEEVFFESSFFFRKKRRTFKVQGRSLLTNSLSLSSLDEEKIGYFSSEKSSFMSALGTYRLEVPSTVRGERQYLALDEDYQKFFVGYVRDQIILPEEERFYTYLQYLGLRDMENVCVVQVNFEKSPISIQTNSFGVGGPLPMDDFYMSRNGGFFTSFENFTRRLFLVGESQGVFNLRIQYEDDTEDYLKTFCNDSVYLIEQL